MENLSDFYIQIAKIELNETEARKEQSIQQFYEWLSKHPFITACEIEPLQILQFLCARKYHMSKVFECFNKSVITVQNVSDLLNFSNVDKLFEIYDKGPYLLTKNYDNNGRRTLIIRHKIIEDLNINFADISKMNYLLATSLTYEPEVQICGINLIQDLRDISINYIKIVDFNLLAKSLPAFDSGPLRLKKIIILGLPTIANSLFEFAKTFLSDKMKSRIILCKNVDNLTNFIDVKDLTVEYGGTESSQDCIDSHRETFKTTGLKAIKFLENLKFDQEKMRNYEDVENVGSFRKLEID